jgi:hypothetical protein
MQQYTGDEDFREDEENADVDRLHTHAFPSNTYRAEINKTIHLYFHTSDTCNTIVR